ncbi:hypothetical protein [Sorangium sp. So ce1335]|uniref:hypothetical protein n=1 Tax=Sorangium sp. So ce1335 TaxID=3133335 RepID=UPI003F60125F
MNNATDASLSDVTVALWTERAPVRVETSPLRIEIETGANPDRTATTPLRMVRRVSISPYVAALVEAHDVDAIDSARAQIQSRLRAYHDESLAAELDALVRGQLGIPCDADQRALAIDALAGAKVALFEPMVVELVKYMCSSGDEHLQVAAIAASTHLRRYRKGELRPLMTLLSSGGSERVRRAAKAFLRVASL